MDFDALTRQWDRFGATDPLWAILTDPARKGNRWDVETFFATGREEIAAVVARARAWGVPHHWSRAFDFGCGVGRLTQALADHLTHAVGVDVAASMIEQARAFNRHGARCRYEVNSRPDLGAFPAGAFDLVYTSRVLQHMEPVYATAYIRELARLLAPGGYLSFDVPSEHGFFPADAADETNLGLDRYRARVRLADLTPLHPAAGGTLTATVEVTNQGPHTWTGDPAHVLNVGNHWLREDGTAIARDDQRVAVPLPWPPGATARVTLRTAAPAAPGRYLLQCDLVEEGRTWFADVGGAAAEVTVIVGRDEPAAPAAVEPPPAEPEPVMEMHAVPRAAVEALLAEAGVTLLDVTRVHHCGPTWLAYRYEASK